jgi:hypothetical protein
MTRLTTVGQMLSPQRQEVERRPARDFAEVLARDVSTPDQGRVPARPSTLTHGDSVPAVPASTSIPTAIPEAPNLPRISNLTVAGTSMSHDVSVDEGMIIRQASLASAVSPVGMTENLQYARVFGVHLLPDRYLSEVALRDVPGEEAMSTARGMSEGNVYVEVPPARMDVRTEPVAEGERLPSMPQALVAMGEATGDTNGNPLIEAVPSSVVAASSGASAIAWSERTLRITGEGEGHAVAWIRDYRLDRHEEVALVQAVLQEARAQGITLGKIIVNGREAWASREAI